MQPDAVEERRRRAADTGDHGVTGLLEWHPERGRDATKRRPCFIVQEHAAGREHRGNIAHRQHQLAIVEVGQDVGRDDEVEAALAEALGDDVEGFAAERSERPRRSTRWFGAGGLSRAPLRLASSLRSDAAAERREVVSEVRR